MHKICEEELIVSHKLKKYQLQWDKIAEKYLAIEDETRYYLLYPAIVDLVRENKYNKILDFGCGNATLAIHIANNERRGREIVCVDSSPNMIKFAKRNINNSPFRKNIKLYNCDQDKIKECYKNYFDLCVVSLVLMTVPNKKEIHSILNSLHYALKQSGHMIIAVTHPAFVDKNFSLVKRNLPFNFKYGDSGKPYQVILKNSHGHELSFYDYHWTIEDYSNFLLNNNFVILNIKEVIYNQKPNMGDAYLIFKCMHKNKLS